MNNTKIKMGYHSGLNGEYNIPVEVNSKHIAHFRRCCKEEVPEKAIKVETYLKDDTIYFSFYSSFCSRFYDFYIGKIPNGIK